MALPIGPSTVAPQHHYSPSIPALGLLGSPSVLPPSIPALGLLRSPSPLGWQPGLHLQSCAVALSIPSTAPKPPPDGRILFTAHPQCVSPFALPAAPPLPTPPSQHGMGSAGTGRNTLLHNGAELRSSTAFQARLAGANPHPVQLHPMPSTAERRAPERPHSPDVEREGQTITAPFISLILGSFHEDPSSGCFYFHDEKPFDYMCCSANNRRFDAAPAPIPIHSVQVMRSSGVPPDPMAAGKAGSAPSAAHRPHSRDGAVGRHSGAAVVHRSTEGRQAANMEVGAKRRRRQSKEGEDGACRSGRAHREPW